MEKKSNISVIKDLLNFKGPFDDTISFLKRELERLNEEKIDIENNLTPLQIMRLNSEMESVKCGIYLREKVQKEILTAKTLNHSELVMDMTGQTNLDVIVSIVRELGAKGFHSRLEDNFETLRVIFQ